MEQGSQLPPCLPVQGMACLDAGGTLLGLGANAHTLVRSAGNDTALHMAARAGRADVIQKLLDCGLNVQWKTKVGVWWGELGWPVLSSVLQMVDRPCCCTTGSRPSVCERLRASYRTCLAVWELIIQPVLALLQALGSLQEDSSILHHAAAFGQAQVLEILVAAGVIVDARDKAQNTALHIAAGEPTPGALAVMLLPCVPAGAPYGCISIAMGLCSF